MRNDSLHVVTMHGESSDPRLTPDEVEALCHFAFRVHDHEAREPAQPIFWYRVDGNELWKFQN
jgi:hypothetical protein